MAGNDIMLQTLQSALLQEDQKRKAISDTPPVDLALFTNKVIPALTVAFVATLKTFATRNMASHNALATTTTEATTNTSKIAVATPDHTPGTLPDALEINQTIESITIPLF
jgi:hypothetical protein